MNFLLLFFLLLVPTAHIQNAEYGIRNTEYVAHPRVEWLTSDEHDFGEIRRNRPARHDFLLKNISAEAFVIQNVRTPCGCTESDWSEEVVEPGKSSRIRIEYDAKDTGYFEKKIKVFISGQRKPEILWIRGEVN